MHISTDIRHRCVEIICRSPSEDFISQHQATDFIDIPLIHRHPSVNHYRESPHYISDSFLCADTGYNHSGSHYRLNFDISQSQEILDDGFFVFFNDVGLFCDIGYDGQFITRNGVILGGRKK